MPDIKMHNGYRPLESSEKHFDQESLSVIYERTVSTKKKFFALLGYFVCNVGLTLYNKAVLGKVRVAVCNDFFPLTLDTSSITLGS